ncbi:MAG TPA: DUF5302 domain-containing protein [Micropruina sp.]|jgi:hypothetical protein|nr:DUF5302 domain-containing protein [Micropruina sp.]
MPDASDPNADTKAAFKAALDRKNAAQQTGADHTDAERGNAKNTHAQGGKRQFRRKSGG